MHKLLTRMLNQKPCKRAHGIHKLCVCAHMFYHPVVARATYKTMGFQSSHHHQVSLKTSIKSLQSNPLFINQDGWRLGWWFGHARTTYASNLDTAFFHSHVLAFTSIMFEVGDFYQETSIKSLQSGWKISIKSLQSRWRLQSSPFLLSTLSNFLLTKHRGIPQQVLQLPALCKLLHLTTPFMNMYTCQDITYYKREEGDIISKCERVVGWGARIQHHLLATVWLSPPGMARHPGGARVLY